MGNLSKEPKNQNREPFSEKIDVQTNNPRKLFRAISDLYKDEMSKRGYETFYEEEPTLDETGIVGVAEFDGCIDMGKIRRPRTKERLISGLIVAVLGVFFFIYLVKPWLDTFNEFPSMLQDYGWAIFVIAAIVVASSKDKTTLMIGIDLKGEGYQYKGNKQYAHNDVEKKERLDVISDVRLILNAFFYKGSYYKKEYEVELKTDWQYISEKLHKIVPEYRIPD